MELLMKSISYGLLSILILLSHTVIAQDWTKEATLPGIAECEDHNGHRICLSSGNRKNIYERSDEELNQYIKEGSKHVMSYPVEITEMQMPYESMKKFFENDTDSPIRKFFYKIAKTISKFDSLNTTFKWLGLHDYPKTQSEIGPNYIPSMGQLEDNPMGVTLLNNPNHSQGMTVSCAACHSSDLFGVKVIGLTNRFPRANEFFILGQKVLKNTPDFAFKALFKADEKEMELLKKSKKAIKSIGLKKPLVLGLDTSLAQVGLSLAKRNKDEYATRKLNEELIPESSGLKVNPADSKPAVWWNVKYKTRWLSDGSIISGNPIHTNFLWNEIGRGVDLKKLEKWMLDNQDKIDELTSYVFASKAPIYNDFFPKRIKISSAKRGQKIFLKTCSGCHGKYDKGWDQNAISYEEKIATTKVWYHKKTPVIDVGTDPYRYKGMKYFADDLNRLKISKTIGTVVKEQKGYVPPPLVGIWARFPYFHNNSAPTLYDVITPDFKRPKSYIAVASDDKEIDFDPIKNGYPKPSKIREPFKSDPDYFYNTKVKGLSNQGHTSMLVDENKEILSEAEKLDLIEFLKTL